MAKTPNDASAFEKSKGKRFPGGMPAEAKYPYANWNQSRGGYHVFTQDEAGKVTQATFHPSGQCRIEYPDGSVVNVSPGQVQYEAEGLQWTARNHADMDVGGHLNLKVSGGIEGQVAGTTKLTLGGATQINITDDAAIVIHGNAQIAGKGTMNINTEGTMNIHAQGGMNLGTDGSLTMQASSIKMQEGGDGAPGYKG